MDVLDLSTAYCGINNIESVFEALAHIAHGVAHVAPSDLSVLRASFVGDQAELIVTSGLDTTTQVLIRLIDCYRSSSSLAVCCALAQSITNVLIETLYAGMLVRLDIMETCFRRLIDSIIVPVTIETNISLSIVCNTTLRDTALVCIHQLNEAVQDCKIEHYKSALNKLLLPAISRTSIDEKSFDTIEKLQPEGFLSTNPVVNHQVHFVGLPVLFSDSCSLLGGDIMSNIFLGDTCSIGRLKYSNWEHMHPSTNGSFARPKDSSEVSKPDNTLSQLIEAILETDKVQMSYIIASFSHKLFQQLIMATNHKLGSSVSSTDRLMELARMPPLLLLRLILNTNKVLREIAFHRNYFRRVWSSYVGVNTVAEKLLRQHSDFDSEVMESMELNLIKFIDKCWSFLPSMRALKETAIGFCLSGGVWSERGGNAIVSLLTVHMEPAIVSNIIRLVQKVTPEHRQSQVIDLLFRVTKHVVAVSPPQQLIEFFPMLEDMFTIFCERHTIEDLSQMRHVLHHLSFRILELPNDWYSGNTLIQLVTGYISSAAYHLSTVEADLVTHTVESLLRGMSQHFSSPPIAEQTNMIANLLLHLNLEQSTQFFTVDAESDSKDMLAFCERCTGTSIFLPPPSSVSIELQPLLSRTNTNSATIPLNIITLLFVIKLDAAGFCTGVIEVHTCNHTGAKDQLILSVPLSGKNSSSVSCCIQVSEAKVPYLTAQLVPVEGSISSIPISGDTQISPYIIKLNFERLIRSVVAKEDSAEEPKVPCNNLHTTVIELDSDQVKSVIQWLATFQSQYYTPNNSITVDIHFELQLHPKGTVVIKICRIDDNSSFDNSSFSSYVSETFQNEIKTKPMFSILVTASTSATLFSIEGLILSHSSKFTNPKLSKNEISILPI